LEVTDSDEIHDLDPHCTRRQWWWKASLWIPFLLISPLVVWRAGATRRGQGSGAKSGHGFLDGV
jgi:hypothetical protein